jgi:hypothetical protein
MPASPGFTLTATLQTIAGGAAGTAANPAKLIIVLCGAGLALPSIAGTSTIAQRKYEVLATSGSAVSQLLWGNDQISPAGTWYSITLVDGFGNVLQTGDYWLTGSGGDLSSLLPKSAGYLVGAAPNGSIPGDGFALPTPLAAGVGGAAGAASAAFYYGGLLQDQRNYSLTSQGLQTDWTVQPGDTLWVSYPSGAAGPGLPIQLWTAITNGVFPGTAYTLPTAPPGAQLVGVFYNGSFQRPTMCRSGGGPDYTLSGGNLTMAFTTDPPDPVTGELPALVALYAVGTAAVTVEEPSGAYPGTVYTLTLAAMAGLLIGLYYNGLFQRPGIDYTLSGTTITLNFSTLAGENIYVAFIPV